MAIQREYSPRLDQHVVYEFARGTGPSWDAPNPTKAGYSLSPVPPKTASVPGVVPLYWARREWYEVTEGGQAVGNFDLVVPWHQDLQAIIKNLLFVKDDVTAAQRAVIETAFKNYNWPADGDPDDYVATKLAGNPENIKRSMFSVDCTFSLAKVGPNFEHDAQKKAVLSVYKDQESGQVWPGPGQAPVKLGDGGYFKTRPLSPRMVKYEVVDDVPPPNIDPVHEINSSNPSSAIDTIISEEGSPLDCGTGYDTSEFPILTLLEYPEFMVEWRDFDYDLGCGVHVVLRLPVLRTRTSELNLWGLCPDAKEPWTVGHQRRHGMHVACVLDGGGCRRRTGELRCRTWRISRGLHRVHRGEVRRVHQVHDSRDRPDRCPGPHAGV